MAFGEKLAGFKSIQIENSENPGIQKVTVVTDGSKELTKEDAVNALGTKATQYEVREWAREQEEVSPEEE